MIKGELMRYLPKRYYEDPVMNNIMDANESELERLFEHIADLARQRFAVTATWGLYEWEKFVGIPHGDGLSIEQRRARVLVKLMMLNTMTHFRLELIVKKFIESSYVVELISDYALKVVITEWELAIKALYEAIEEAKPAHLGLIIEFKLEHELYFGLYARDSVSTKIRPPILAGKEELKVCYGHYAIVSAQEKIRPAAPGSRAEIEIMICNYAIQYESLKIS